MAISRYVLALILIRSPNRHCPSERIFHPGGRAANEPKVDGMISADAAWQSSPRACQPVAFPRRMVLALVLGDCVYLLTHCVVPVKAGNSRFETGFLVQARVALRNTRARWFIIYYFVPKSSTPLIFKNRIASISTNCSSLS